MSIRYEEAEAWLERLRNVPEQVQRWEHPLRYTTNDSGKPAVVRRGKVTIVAMQCMFDLLARDRELDPRVEDVMRLYYLDGRHPDEIATFLGRGVRTYQRLRRAGVRWVANHAQEVDDIFAEYKMDGPCRAKSLQDTQFLHIVSTTRRK